METAITIENVVASTTLASNFDLQKMEIELERAKYNKLKFPGLIYRYENSNITFLIFTSGKVVCSGSKTVNDAHKAILNLANTLRSIGCEKICLEPEIYVRNVVASGDLKANLNLNAVASALGIENVEYEPEIFPGLVYRVEVPKVVVLVFSSGKLVITGGKCPEDCKEGMQVIRTLFDNLGLIT